MESESKLVNVTRQKDARTANFAVTHSTSLNSVLDLFFVAGASRNISEEDIIKMLQRAWVEDELLTLKCIFWAGNVRGGAGERRFFRIALKWLEEQDTYTLVKNLKYVPEFTRWDNLFHLDSPEVFELVDNALSEGNGLCAKWMPRKKQYNNFADKFRRKFHMSPKDYRKLLVALSKTVEQDMCDKNWDKIEYSHVPSVAMHKYRKAFFRNDESRFSMFIDKVDKGEAKMKAEVLFPYSLYQAYERGENKKAINAQWKSLPNFMEGNTEKILPVCDVSGSMYGLPISISVSLGVYLSERNESIFKDAFVTFSSRPTMQYLSGSVTERFTQLDEADWSMNTDLSAVFNLILKRAVEENVSSSEMPSMILIISDMEFDECGRLTNYENIVEKYKEAGYEIPKIVFWNVNGRPGNVPVSKKSKNVGLISGATPAVVKSVLGGKDFTPVGIMLETLNSDKYNVLELG